jgi:aspartate/methionine/tyrosine aminotransferase
MNPLATEANSIIEAEAPAVMRMLSALGKELYFPKGILTQTAEANQKAHRYNATIGEAREEKHSMGLGAIMRHFCELGADAVLPYASSYGRADLRAAWRDEIREKNPSLGDTPISLPVVTSGITHGLSTVADMFVDPGDLLLVPDKLWGNYLMVFGVKRGAQVVRHPLLDMDDGLDLAGFRQAVEDNASRGKLLVLFNFPNNPTGYSITEAEADALRDILVATAESGCDIVAVCDDAYFGLFFDDEVMKESLFTRLAAAHPRILAVKLDGASKEDFAWGLRVAFMTYGIAGGAGSYEALEKKTGGCIRGAISNAPNVSQQLILRAMQDPEYKAQKAEKSAVLRRRAEKVREVLADPKFAPAWKPYPFNSGYFMCLRMKGLDAEEYRIRLLDEYGVGVISTSDTDIRIAHSCVDEADIPDLFEVMLRCALEMQRE